MAKKNPNGQQFAIKTIPKHKIMRDMKTMMLRELEILQSADHPNIIKLYETYEDSRYLHMVMEMCTGGNMLDRIVNQGTHSENEAAVVMSKLCLAVNHLHELFICHRDIKPDNCIYASEDPSSEIKLLDFGLSNKFGNEKVEGLYSLVGTPYYMAPEILKGNYRKECDVWSLGVLLYLLLSGRQAFASMTHKELFPKIIAADYDFNGEEWVDISNEAKDLISLMLVVDPKRRLTITQVLKHRWFLIQKVKSGKGVSLEIIRTMKRKCAWNYLQKESMKIIVKYLSSNEIEDLKVISP